jgi:tol-pal system protein YbgF
MKQIKHSKFVPAQRPFLERSFLWRSIRGYGLVVTLVLTGIFTSLPEARAQDGAIVDELQRLRRDLDGLQQYVYKNEGAVSAGVQQGADAPAQAQFNARIQRQMQVLQDRMRDLTGLVEEVQHNIATVGSRLDKLVGDVDLRLQLLEQNSGAQPANTATYGGAPRQTQTGQTPASPTLANPTRRDRPQAGTAAPGATTVITSAGVQRSAPQAVQGQAPGAAPGRTLGTISQNAVESVRRGEIFDLKSSKGTVAPGIERKAVARNLSNPPNAASPANPVTTAAPAPGRVAVGRTAVASTQGALLPSGTPKEQYTYALSLLRKRNYTGAETAFKAFIDKYPKNALSGNAMYWMGETFYVRKNFSEAARIFLDGYQRFPKGGKASGNLLKLAKSLSEIGEITSACASYNELLKTFPGAGARTISTARNELARLKCG